jgi:virulence factor
MSTKSNVKVACIGAGNMANGVHYPALHEFEDVEIVGLCDIVPDKLQQTAEKFEIENIYSDYRKMLDETQPDAVYILMPPHHVFDLAVESLNRGHHIFVEKPPGLTTNQTRSLARLAERKDALTMAGFQRRFCPLLVEAKRQAEERGPIIQCLARFVKSGGVVPYYGGAIDILTCDAIHAVDMLRWMGGDVKKLASTVGSYYAEMDNAFNALIEFESGAVGMLLTNWVTGRRTYAVEMHSKNFTVYADPDEEAIFYKDDDTKGDRLQSSAITGSDEMRHTIGFTAENRHFIDSIKAGTQPQTNFDDAVKTMELIDRIYSSQL